MYNIQYNKTTIAISIETAVLPNIEHSSVLALINIMECKPSIHHYWEITEIIYCEKSFLWKNSETHYIEDFKTYLGLNSWKSPCRFIAIKQHILASSPKQNLKDKK